MTINIILILIILILIIIIIIKDIVINNNLIFIEIICMKPTDIKPPFDEETAKEKVKAAQDAWNSRNPESCRSSIHY